MTPTLTWLGDGGFAVRFATITFCVDMPAQTDEILAADMVLSTDGLVGPSVARILDESQAAKLILPKSAADGAHAAGIPYERMTTTDSGLRVEYFKDNLYGRVYAIPVARPQPPLTPQLDWTPVGGYPYLGYLIRFGLCTIYHGGDSVPYPELADRLRPYNVSVALLPVGERNFSASDAAQLAEDIGAKWVAPMHCDPETTDHFVDHMLGQRPTQRFKVFSVGETWAVPEE